MCFDFFNDNCNGALFFRRRVENIVERRDVKKLFVCFFEVQRATICKKFQNGTIYTS